MGHQQNRDAADGTDGSPSHFIAFDPVLTGQPQRITKNLRGHLKCNAIMLALIGDVLVLIPRKPDFRHGNNVTTNLQPIKSASKAVKAFRQKRES